MRLASQIAALLEGLLVSDIEALPPAERRRFADACRHWAKVADRAEAPRSGVLADLRQGRQT